MTGTKTGFCSVVTGPIVAIVLQYLYHLPKAVLAACVIMAIINPIDFTPIVRVWRASKPDGIAAIVTFVATLYFASNIIRRSILGANLAIAFYLYLTMELQVSILGSAPDSTLQDVCGFHLDRSQYIAALNFKGSLYFVSVARFESSIITAVTEHSNRLLCAGDGQKDQPH